MKKVVAVFEAPLAPMRYYQFNGIAKILENNFLAIIHGKPSNFKIDLDDCKFKYHFVKSAVIRIRRYNSHYEWRNIHIPFKLFVVLVKERPDVILASGMSIPSFLCLLYKLIFRARLVIHSEGTPFTERNITNAQKILRKKIFINRVNGFLVGGKESYEYIKLFDVASHKIFVAPYSTDIQYFHDSTELFRKQFNRSSKLQPRLIYVGQLIKRKGVDKLLRIFAELLTQWPNCELWVIGDGEERARLATQSCNLGISRNVIFYGAINNSELPRYFAQCDVFIFPSLEDTFAVVIAEAMAAGLPVIANKNVGAVADLISQKETGFVIDFNDENNVINTIKFCFDNLEHLKINILNYIKNWSSDLAVYNTLLSFGLVNEQK